MILVINSGSSSIKFALFTLPNFETVAKGLLEEIGKPESQYKFSAKGRGTMTVRHHFAYMFGPRHRKEKRNQGPQFRNRIFVFFTERRIRG